LHILDNEVADVQGYRPASKPLEPNGQHGQNGQHEVRSGTDEGSQHSSSEEKLRVNSSPQYTSVSAPQTPLVAPMAPFGNPISPRVTATNQSLAVPNRQALSQSAQLPATSKIGNAPAGVGRGAIPNKLNNIGGTRALANPSNQNNNGNVTDSSTTPPPNLLNNISNNSPPQPLATTPSPPQPNSNGTNKTTTQVCAGCGRGFEPMDKKWLAIGKSWHPTCFKCFDCHNPINNGHFVNKGGTPHCRNCYSKAKHCGRCGQELTEDFAMAASKSFHLECFTCFICQKQLSANEPVYSLNSEGGDGQPICADCQKVQVNVV